MVVVMSLIPRPAFLIRTKHHAPPTYVGAAFERVGRSSVFAFSSRAFAAQVARGLENHRKLTGSYPSVTEDGLQLEDGGESLDTLEILEVDDHGLRGLVEGSGVAVCYMRLDAEDDDIHAAVVYDKKIQRTWIHDLYGKPDVSP